MLVVLLSWVVMLLVSVVCGWVGWWLLLKPSPPPASVTQPYSSPSLLYPLKVVVFYCLVKLRKVSTVSVAILETYEHAKYSILGSLKYCKPSVVPDASGLS